VIAILKLIVPIFWHDDENNKAAAQTKPERKVRMYFSITIDALWLRK
jgi:hypothetical protein